MQTCSVMIRPYTVREECPEHSSYHPYAVSKRIPLLTLPNPLVVPLFDCLPTRKIHACKLVKALVSPILHQAENTSVQRLKRSHDVLEGKMIFTAIIVFLRLRETAIPTLDNKLSTACAPCYCKWDEMNTLQSTV